MTSAERVILRVLLDEYENKPEVRGQFGPYGRTMLRTGVEASRVAEVEHTIVGYPLREARNSATDEELRQLFEQHFELIRKALL